MLQTPYWWPEELGPSVGKYEVKRLSRSSKTRWDPRFKTGTRGTRIYGRHSALVKAAALEIEDNLKYIDIDRWVAEDIDPREVKRCFHLMLADAYADRHSHRFRKAFDRICKELSDSGFCFPMVDRYLRASRRGPITSDQICLGYADIDGLIFIRGDTYTLIKRDAIPQHIGFDSFGSEGLKLRMLTVVSENKQRSGKLKVEKQ